MLFEPVLYVCAVVGVAVSSDDRVVHQRALERHVFEIFCGGTASGGAAARVGARTGGFGQRAAGRCGDAHCFEACDEIENES